MAVHKMTGPDFSHANPDTPVVPGQKLLCRPDGTERRTGALQRLRGRLFALIKAPLLRRYDVRWQWPKAVDRAGWESVTIPSPSGAALAGVYRRAPIRSKGVVVCAHPLRKDAKGFFLSTGRAELLLRHGFDVLAFDFNGFGESGAGDFWYAADMLAAAAFAASRAEGRPVHALAGCFGGVWVLCAAVHDHPFSAIVIESPLTTLQEYYAGHPLARVFFGLLWRMFPRSAAQAQPMAAIARLRAAPRVLLVSGLADAVTPPDMARRIFDAFGRSRSACRVWYVDGGRHLRAYETAPAEYERQVIEFLDRACPETTLMW